MFELFPGHYRWSYNAWAALAAGGEFGDLGLILDRLRGAVGRDETWYEAWTWLADVLEQRAEENLSVGTKASAGENYFLASLYHKIAEQFVPPADPLRRITGSSVCSFLTKGRHCQPISSPAKIGPVRTRPSYF